MGASPRPFLTAAARGAEDAKDLGWSGLRRGRIVYGRLWHG